MSNEITNVIAESPEVKPVAVMQPRLTGKPSANPLSKRQRKAVELLVEGLSVPEVAKRLGVDKSSIYRYFGSKGFGQALSTAIRDRVGLIELKLLQTALTGKGNVAALRLALEYFAGFSTRILGETKVQHSGGVLHGHGTVSLDDPELSRRLAAAHQLSIVDAPSSESTGTGGGTPPT